MDNPAARTPVLGIELAAWRKAHGFSSQAELAKRLDVSVRTITRMEASADPLPGLYTLALEQLTTQYTIAESLTLAQQVVARLRQH